MKTNGGGNPEGAEKKSRNPKRIYLRGKRYAGSLGQVNKTVAKEKLDINRELACFRNMLNMAIGWGKLARNPFKTGPVKLFKEMRGKPRA